MKKISIVIFILTVIVAVSACEGCVNKAAKKVTNLGMSALEGVAEAVSERGDTLSEKITDAAGTVAQGAGRSLNRQLDEHAETVAAVAGRTLVQTVEGLEEGIGKEHCDEMVSKEDLCSDVSLYYFGKIKEKPVTVASFIITENGTYTAKFEFCNDNCKTAVLTKTAEVVVATDSRKGYSSVSFAYNNEELALLESAKCTKITVTRK
jgi:uncharacterized protein YpmB